MEKPAPLQEEVIAGETVVMNKNDMQWTEEEKQKIEAALAEAQEKNQIVLLKGNKNEKKTITSAEELQATATLYLKDCHDFELVVDSPCTKVLIEGCTNIKVALNQQIKTEILEIWRCEGASLEINTVVKTLQADLSKRLTVNYKKREFFNHLVWGGVYDLDLSVGEGEQKLISKSGYEQMKETHPDINDQFDQFICRIINGELLQEQIVRLANGYPTTEREAREFDERQRKNEEAKEQYIRNLVKFAAPKLGLKDDRKRPKVGRNNPCPCGSAKKFKSCCWNKYEH